MSAASIEAMLAAVPYRGPDGLYVRVCDGVGLGHAKMVVTPEEEHERQPLVSPRTSCAITADVRLDNRDELLAQLPDSRPAASDAELILSAYETWGPDAPTRLLGDFAFVIWDPRNRRIVCARDTSGQRPLFYRLDRRTFAAASEIHQLFQDPSVDIRPNDEHVRDFLVPLRVFRNDQEQSDTFFEGIRTVPAGHTLVVEADTERLTHYWRMRAPREVRYRRNQQYVQHFGDLFASAVRSRLRSTHKVGAMLSGGLDSASIVSMAQMLYRLGTAEDRGFLSLSMSFDNLDCDESSFVRDVQAKYGFEARFIPVVDRILTFAAQPAGFMAAPIKAAGEVDLMLEEANAAGVRVLLSGFLADNCFGWSQQFFDSLLRRGRFGELWHHLRAYRRTAKESLSETLALYCLLPLLPLPLQRPLRVAHAKRNFARERHQLVPAWMSEAVRQDLLARHLRVLVGWEATRQFPGVERERIFRSLYPAEVTPASGAVPVQIVRPFADRRLHEFVLSIPPEQLFEPHPYADQFYAGSKLILRRAMLEILPESVRTRTRKTEFSPLILAEVNQHWPDYSAAFGPHGTSQVARCGYVNPALFWERLQHLREGSFGEDGVYVMRVLQLETWLRTFELPRPNRTTVAAPTTSRLSEHFSPHHAPEKEAVVTGALAAAVRA